LNKKEFPQEWNKSIIGPIYKKTGKADCGNYGGILLLTSYVIQYSLKVNSAFKRNYWRSVWIPTKQITFLASVRYWRKKLEYHEIVHQPSITSRRPIIQSGGKNSSIFSMGLIRPRNS
jgi:hypothetical protein